MKRFLATTALAAAVAVSLTGTGHAAPLSTTYAVAVYQFNNPNPGNGSDPSQAALPGFAPGGGTVSTFTYTGALNFNLGSGATDTVAAFIASGGGTTVGTVPNTTLSGSNFTTTSLFKFTFATGAIASAIISHDDGVSLFVSGKTGLGDDLLPLSASAPTSLATTAVTNLAAGIYDLYYVEANNLPADLTFNVVPEPSSLILLGAGLLGLGAVFRRGSRNETSIPA